MSSQPAAAKSHPTVVQNVDTSAGFIAAIFVFICWGMFPMFWKQLIAVTPLEIICHRVVWSLVLVIPLLLITGQMRDALSAMKGRELLVLICTSTLLGSNWLLFIWAVNTGKVLETSLGNFIVPLTTTLIGSLFFKDKPRRPQWVAIGFAVIGVIILIVGLGYLPWIPLQLALTLSVYSLLRKIITVNGMVGLFVENFLYVIPAGCYLYYLHTNGEGHFVLRDPYTSMLLVAGGFLTATCMGFFAFATRNLRMMTLGVMHYIVPTTSFILGVFVYGERFTTIHGIAFSCIWAGLVVYTVDANNMYRQARKLTGKLHNTVQAEKM